MVGQCVHMHTLTCMCNWAHIEWLSVYAYTSTHAYMHAPRHTEWLSVHTYIRGYVHVSGHTEWLSVYISTHTYVHMHSVGQWQCAILVVDRLGFKCPHDPLCEKFISYLGSRHARAALTN